MSANSAFSEGPLKGLDEDLEPPTKLKLLDVLLGVDVSAIAIMFHLISGTSGGVRHSHHHYFVFMTGMTLVFLAWGATDIIWHLWLKDRNRDLRYQREDNDERRRRGEISFDQWEKKEDRCSKREWPYLWHLWCHAEEGIEFSLVGLGLFLIWIIYFALTRLP